MKKAVKMGQIQIPSELQIHFVSSEPEILLFWLFSTKCLLKLKKTYEKAVKMGSCPTGIADLFYVLSTAL